MNRMMVMDKLPKNARGSFVWTLLQGRALEVVEHLREEEYQKEGGDAVIFALLDSRWPAKDRTDEIGENISEVFTLKAREGESVRLWCARARECFDRCSRKSGVDFPSEARGWILLNCSGMNEEQRAVVLARAQGVLKFDDLAQSMRSCFPEFTVPKKRHTAVSAVDPRRQLSGDEEDEAISGDAQQLGFDDVELFLAEHGEGVQQADSEIYEETEVAEVLAATWRDRRQELGKLQKQRRFQKASEVKRSFRVEIEELKKPEVRRRRSSIGFSIFWSWRQGNQPGGAFCVHGHSLE